MDKQLADQLAHDLDGVAEVWLDYRRLRPGDSIQATIDGVLVQMDVVLLVWTEHAQASQGVRNEVRACRKIGARLVPCFFQHNDAGKPHPSLPKSLRDVLGIDFHHYGTGLARLMEYIVSEDMGRLPEDARLDDHPAKRMLHYLQGYMEYLSNYRKLRDVPDARAYWVDKIIAEIERFVNAGGDAESVRMLLDGARQQEANDPEGIGMLVSRLERLLSGSSTGSAASAPRTDPPADELAVRVSQVVPAGTAEAWLAGVNTYIKSAPPALQSLTSYAQAAQSSAGVQVVTFLQQYLEQADDLIPDHRGQFGLLDDAWLILNTAFRLVESGLVPAAAVPVDWQTIITADHVVRSMLPPPALSQLTTFVMQMLQMIALEVASYQPWLTPEGHGYAPTIAQPRSTGGAWEDQMNEMLLGTGLSV